MRGAGKNPEMIQIFCFLQILWDSSRMFIGVVIDSASAQKLRRY